MRTKDMKTHRNSDTRGQTKGQSEQKRFELFFKSVKLSTSFQHVLFRGSVGPLWQDLALAVGGLVYKSCPSCCGGALWPHGWVGGGGAGSMFWSVLHLVPVLWIVRRGAGGCEEDRHCPASQPVYWLIHYWSRPRDPISLATLVFGFGTDFRSRSVSPWGRLGGYGGA